MGHTCGIRGICLEPNAEDIILVVPGDMKVVCVRLVMAQSYCCHVQFRDIFLLLNGKPMKLVSDLWKGFQAGD
jgi:hypothetical protein